jgi:hypothetical protein
LISQSGKGTGFVVCDFFQTVRSSNERVKVKPDRQPSRFLPFPLPVLTANRQARKE